MKKILFLLGSLSLHFIASAQSWSDTLKSIETVLDRYQSANPGYELAISRNGQLLLSKAEGMADLEHNVPMTTTTLTEAGSVSKQFTAASILLLEQQGKLSLQDDVRKYIPELPSYGDPITLRHLMQHTSGVRDWGAVMELTGWPRTTRNYTNEHALLIIARQKALNNKPGDEFIYSNSNYTLLAIIVERVSGKSLAEFTSEYIFKPAGMKHTQWRTNMKTIVPNRAMAYAKAGTVYETNMPNESVYGHAGLLTTAEDLLAWNNFYLSGKFGTPSLLSKQLAEHSLNNGIQNHYTAGLVVDSARGWKHISHNGATASYRADLQSFPDLGLSVAWLSNTSEFDSGKNVPAAIVKLLVADVKKAAVKPVNKNEETTAKATVTVSEKNLQQYVGDYYSSDADAKLSVTLKDGKLSLVQQPTIDYILTPIYIDGFKCDMGRLRFERDSKKGVIGFKISVPRALNVEFLRVYHTLNSSDRSDADQANR